MKDQQLLKRISLNPDVMAGKPVIRGTRLTVEYILNLLAHGATIEEILEAQHGGHSSVPIVCHQIVGKYRIWAAGHGVCLDALSGG